MIYIISPQQFPFSHAAPSAANDPPQSISSSTQPGAELCTANYHRSTPRRADWQKIGNWRAINSKLLPPQSATQNSTPRRLELESHRNPPDSPTNTARLIARLLFMAWDATPVAAEQGRRKDWVRNGKEVLAKILLRNT